MKELTKYFVLSLHILFLQISSNFLLDTVNAEYLNSASKNMASQQALQSLEFEVFGKVQGVFFRKYTMAKAKELGLGGWCRNTSQGTVSGVLEGSAESIHKMKSWLQTQGSPKSRISRAEFKNEKSIPAHTCPSFAIRK